MLTWNDPTGGEKAGDAEEKGTIQVLEVKEMGRVRIRRKEDIGLGDRFDDRSARKYFLFASVFSSVRSEVISVNVRKEKGYWRREIKKKRNGVRECGRISRSPAD